jgi:hypothetical protein
MAQEVAKKHPDAVGKRNGYMTVDYHEATEDAAHRGHFYGGGLVLRQGHANGERVIADYSEEADMPALGATPISLNTAPAYDPEDLAIRTIAAETGGDPNETKGIAAVIKNRLDSGRYGKGLGDVVLAKGQFEPWSKPDAPNYPMRYEPGNKRYEAAKDAWNAVLQGDDPTGGATHFWAPKAQTALGRAAPSWGREGGIDIGATRFHKLENDGGLGSKYLTYAPQTNLGSSEASRAIDQAAGKATGLASYFPTKKDDTGAETTDWKKILIPLLTTAAGVASAPTRNWGTALAMGLGAGAQSFANLEKQQADVAFRNAETGKVTQETQLQLLDRLNSINAVRYGKGLPLIKSVEEYMRRIKDGTIYDATAGETSSKPTGTVTGNPVKGQNEPGAADTVAGNTGTAKLPGNVNVGEDLAEIDWNNNAPSNRLPVMQNELETLQRMMTLPSLSSEQYADYQKKAADLSAKIDAISKQDFLLDIKGNKITPKSWSDYKQYQQNLPKITEMMNQGSEAYKARQQARYQLDNISRAFETLKTGAFTDVKTDVKAALEAAGYPVKDEDLKDITSAQTAVKNAWDRIFARLGEVGGQVRVLEIQGMQKASPDINLQPGANRNLISSGIATLDYEDKYYNDMVAAKNKLGSKFDPATFAVEWQRQNRDLMRDLSSEAKKNVALRGTTPTLSNGAINVGDLEKDHNYIIEPGMGIPGVTKPTKVKYLGLNEKREPQYQQVQ